MTYALFPEQLMQSRPGAGLAQRSVKSRLPPGIVNAPADFGSRHLECGLPYLPIAFVFCNVEAIDYRHATCKFALRLNFDIMFAPVRADGRVECEAHRDRIGQTDSIFTSLNFVCGARVAVALDRESRELGVELQNTRDIAFVEHGLAAAKVPSDQLHRKTASHHNARRFRVDPDVVFGCGSDIA